MEKILLSGCTERQIYSIESQSYDCDWYEIYNGSLNTFYRNSKQANLLIRKYYKNRYVKANLNYC